MNGESAESYKDCMLRKQQALGGIPEKVGFIVMDEITREYIEFCKSFMGCNIR